MPRLDAKEALGMSLGTAANRLRKMMMLQLLRDLLQDACERCGKPIETVEELSIDHMAGWETADEYFDVRYVGFSHRVCNSANRMPYVFRKYTDWDRK